MREVGIAAFLPLWSAPVCHSSAFLGILAATREIISLCNTEKGNRLNLTLREFPMAKSLVLRYIAQLEKKETLALTLGANIKVGSFTQTIDKASPRHHTPGLYNGKSKAQASILCQLRTRIAHLNGYLSRINVVEFEMCACKTGAETAHHFLFYCPLWVLFRSSIKDIG